MENNGVVEYLRQAIVSGKHWYIALLEAVGLWTEVEENYRGRVYCYLIAGEAFDWLLLAERLCDAVGNLIPEEGKNALLLQGKAPLDLPPDKFRELIGSTKYNQYLNYFYGITVEEALIRAVQREIHKERQGFSAVSEREVLNEAYHRIYDAARATLLNHFRQEKGSPKTKHPGPTELKEFTYWLFKYRLKRCDGERVASDTKKALEHLKRRLT